MIFITQVCYDTVEELCHSINRHRKRGKLIRLFPVKNKSRSFCAEIHIQEN